MRHFTTAGCTLAVLMVVMLAREALAGVNFVVGGDSGWTNTANIDYNQYMSTYKVKLGDTLEFVNNDDTDHTVTQVDKAGYDSCGSSGTQIESLTIGSGISDTLTPVVSGDLYVICTIPAHCVQGMKVYIQVLNADGTVNTTASQSSAAPQIQGFSSTSQLMLVVVATLSLIIAAAAM